MQNSPANRIPSHGTEVFASSNAIDFVPVDDRGVSAPITFRTLFRPEPPERFSGFGRPILSPATGRIVARHDALPDHPAYRGFPSVGYALTQRQRAAEGWPALAGNYVGIDTGHGILFLCHLRRGSVKVEVGARIGVGDVVAACGNSGNSTEPHVHVQAVDNLDIDSARPVEIRFNGSLPRNGEVVDAG
ncbi:M23 family metallopeptidase [Gulosibacter molinativorax]|uniref:M23 family metallopeptidase n=1 Tax=Gulosibacter molinativorax TaxID=256821 RepID=UPI000409203C|nr:M23 family metallopeptidase [Gulosibacter molinativorax]QUY62434.1 Glycyl-glycine endopeptidase LytM [Gulosibacter molinativorax]